MERQRGTRTAAQKSMHIALGPRKRKSSVKSTMTPADRRRAAKLIACAGIFGIAVLARIIFPGFGSRIGEVVNRDADFASVFSSIGESLAEDGKLTTAFKSVYGFLTGQEAEPASGDGGGEDMDGDAAGAVPSADTPAANGADAGEAGGSITAEGASALNEELNLSMKDSFASQGAVADDPEQLYLRSQSEYEYLDTPVNVSSAVYDIPFEYVSPHGGAVGSGFGYRESPISAGEVAFHYGLDFEANEGDPVTSFASGTVIATGESSTMGKYIQISHGENYVTIYGHLSAVNVSSGEEVAAGQAIGLAGSSGQSTGPHLHFEITVDGVYINPAYYVAVESLWPSED